MKFKILPLLLTATLALSACNYHVEYTGFDGVKHEAGSDTEMAKGKKKGDPPEEAQIQTDAPVTEVEESPNLFSDTSDIPASNSDVAYVNSGLLKLGLLYGFTHSTEEIRKIVVMQDMMSGVDPTNEKQCLNVGTKESPVVVYALQGILYITPVNAKKVGLAGDLSHLFDVTDDDLSYEGVTKSTFSPITSILLTGVDTTSATNMEYMFANLPNLERLNIADFDLSTVSSFDHMFANDTKLSTIWCSKESGDTFGLMAQGWSYDSSQQTYTRK